MTRRLGVLVAMLALAGTAVAGPAKKTAAKPDPKAAKADPKADPTPLPDDTAPVDDPTAGAPAEAEEPIPPHITGPAKVDLGSQTSIDLPEGTVLLEKVEAQKFLAKGGSSSPNAVAVIFSVTSKWWIAIDYDPSGYVDDGDADKLDANELLDSYKEGVKQQNIERRARGISDMILDGWSEMPRYVHASHQLLWGLRGHSVTDGQTDVTINYFTRILGRNGYLSVDLIDSPETIEQAKVESAPVLNAIHFAQGARYEDHKSDDKSSGIGLRALVLGGAGIAVVKGSGFFIGILLALKKFVILVVAGIAGFFKWLFGRGKKKDLDIPPSPPPPSAPPPPSDPSPPPTTTV